MGMYKYVSVKFSEVIHSPLYGESLIDSGVFILKVFTLLRSRIGPHLLFGFGPKIGCCRVFIGLFVVLCHVQQPGSYCDG